MKKPEPIVFITGNLNKVEEVKKYLNYPIDHVKLDLVEIQSVDLKEIVEHKAREAYKHIQKPVLVEDVSLTFTALGKLPGPLIKWFLKELGTEKLCHLLDNFENRLAIAEIIYGLYDGKKVKMFAGQTHGTIPLHPQGEGFGWNPIFIPKGAKQTWAEMPFEERAKTSMRGIALKKLEKFITKI